MKRWGEPSTSKSKKGEQNVAGITKRVVYRIGLYGVAGIVAFGIYEQGNVPPETDAEYCERTGRVKIHDRYFKYDVYENGELKTVSDMLSRGCDGEPHCEVDRIYQYVLKIPYKESATSRTPSDVINQNGGDCDEKSFLLASLLMQKGYDCVLVTTKDHGFVGVHLPNDPSSKQPLAYLLIGGKRYYFAETTLEGGYVGQYNNVGKHEFEAVFDMVRKREVPLGDVEFHGVKG